jgi:hypothetical protein
MKVVVVKLERLREMDPESKYTREWSRHAPEELGKLHKTSLAPELVLTLMMSSFTRNGFESSIELSKTARASRPDRKHCTNLSCLP